MNAVAAVAAAGAAVALAAALEQLDAGGFLANRPTLAGPGLGPGPGPAVMPRPAIVITGPLRHAVVGIIVLCAVLLIAGANAALLAGAAAGGASAVRARRAMRGRARACEQATPALARVLADALRGGASIRSALVAAADDRSIPSAMRSVLADAGRALSAGAALRPALRSLSEVGGPSLRLLCGTVALHLESGGRLSTELERLATAADAARRVEHDRIAATAQARATVRVVGLLPLLALGGAHLASPGFLVSVTGNPIGLALLLLGLTLEVVAFVAARAIVGPVR